MTKTPEELTEDWKAGKLDDGAYYYVETQNGIMAFSYDKQHILDNDVKQILAPVPDYEEFESLRKTANGVKYVSDKCWEKTKALEGNVTMFKSLFRQYLEREKDIAKLRALLKEGTRLLSFEHETYEAENFIKEVNEVLK